MDKKEEKSNIDFIDLSKGKPKSDFLKAVEEFSRYQSGEIEKGSKKSMLIIADDSNTNMTFATMMGSTSSIIDDLIELMKNNDVIRNIIIKTSFLYMKDSKFSKSSNK